MSGVEWLKLWGVLAYASTVGLTMLWVGIGIAYWRAGRGAFTWSFFIGSMLCYAFVFVGLTVVASEPGWLDRQNAMLFQRTTAIIAALAGWTYTWSFLASEWKQRKGANDGSERS
jgi:hypothetical protein